MHGAYLINASRGDLQIEADIISALDDGTLAAATLDVFAVEPLPPTSRLLDVPGLLLSPHMAGSSGEAAMRIIGKSKANLQRVLDGVPVVDVVNGADPAVRRR
jgi:D-3-phosphoglycerate dehydrogenase